MNNRLILLDEYKRLKADGEPLVALCETYTGRYIKVKTRWSASRKKIELILDDGGIAIYDKMSFKQLMLDYNSNPNNKDKIRIACRYGTIMYFNRKGEQIPDPESIFTPKSLDDMEDHLIHLGHGVIDGWKIVDVIGVVDTGGKVFAVIEEEGNKYFVTILKDGTVYEKFPYDEELAVLKLIY